MSAVNVELDAQADRIIADCAKIGDPKSFFLFAGAGSGKTRSLVAMLEGLFKGQQDVLMSRGQRVAVITYTNAACEVISQRLKFSPLLHVSTIHSFAWSLIGGYHGDIRFWLRKTLTADISELTATLGKTRAGTKIRVEREASLAEKSERLARLNDVRVFTYSPTGENSGRDSLNHSEVIQLCASFLSKKTLQSVLVGRFPFLFIDESQDTNAQLIDGFMAVEAASHGKFCLGLFGDMMQRIYSDGKVGLETIIPQGWSKPEKVMNWRCAKRVVRLINAIRKPVDGRDQQAPPGKIEGFVRCFVYPSNTENKTEIENTIALRMSDITSDAQWSALDGYKTLTLEHHMAARRLGFSECFLPLYRMGSLRTALMSGELSGLPLFFEAILPLVKAGLNNDKFELARIIRTRSPLLQRKYLAQVGDDKGKVIEKARAGVAQLLRLFDQTESVPTALEVLQCVAANELFEIPRSLSATLQAVKAGLGSASDDPDGGEKGLIAAWYEALQAPFTQLEPFAEYLAGASRFDTHQGVKGREFPRVMVIMDDEEARGFLFKYDKLLGVDPKSKTDLDHEAKGEETTFDRTRRLLYVTCSRAEASLALVVYTASPEVVREHVIRAGWFENEEMEVFA
jgi:DNA helicase-2/ATP-dependent DNA helicase PcrA